METPIKVCSICGKPFPNTVEFFSLVKKYNHLVPHCRACGRMISKRWKDNHPDKVKAYRDRQWDEKGAEIIQKKRERREADPEYAEKVNAYQRAWYNANKDRYADNRLAWRTKNAEYLRQRALEYAKQHPERSRLTEARRRARKMNLPDAFTTEDWIMCQEWWGYCCAYCGSQQGFWNDITADHFIPLISPECPGTVPENMIPACRTCNSSKHTKDAAKWLSSKFGKRHAKRILKRIAEYQEWLNH